MRKTITVLAGAALLALAATGCSTVNTAPDQIALHCPLHRNSSTEGSCTA